MLFEFAKTKPSPSKSWKLINATDLPTVTKTLLWVSTLLTTDFEQFKASAQSVESGDVTPDQLFSVVSGRLSESHSITLSSAPNDITEFSSIDLGYPSDMREPMVTLWSLLTAGNSLTILGDFLNTLIKPSNPIQVDAQLVIFHKVFANSNYSTLSPLTVQLLPDYILFSDANFRTFFPAGTGTKSISSTDDIKPYLRAQLSANGESTFPLPEFTLA